MKWSQKRSILKLRGGAKRLLGRLRFDHSILFLLALLTGILAGYGAIGFRLLINGWSLFLFGADGDHLIGGLALMPWWQIMLIPIAGGFLVAGLLRFLMPEKRPLGVAEVIEAVALRDGRMPIRSALANAFSNATALGFGASVGREGPVVHLAAALAAFIGDRLHLTPAITRTLIGCGVASGVAASFNAPIAGVLFALEVVVGHYALHAFAPIVLAGVAGTVVSRIHLGNTPAFTLPDLQIMSLWEFPAFGVLGIVSALMAILFMYLIFKMIDARQALLSRPHKSLPEWSLPPLAGLCVGVVAIWLPEIIGVGYEGADLALKGSYELNILLVLLGGKILLTALCFAAGFGTGVFSPSLFIGAMLGGAFGLGLAQAFPGLVSDPGVYAVVGMGAFASAILGAPMSTMLIIFEMTGDYEVTLAVMVAAAISSMITHFSYAPSFFLKQLLRRGLSLEAGKASYLLKSTGTKEVMRTDVISVKPQASIFEVRHVLMAQGGGKLMVTDDAGALLGIISLSDLPDEAFDPELDHLVRAAEIVRANPAVVYAFDSLEQSLGLLERTGEPILPVLSDPNDRILIGLLHHEDVLKAYTRALLHSHGQG
ncbi:chloride channel protein [Iodidimonas nitroreducens]|uniref:Chloride channel protein n=1 Tax=Iodidimonas nitroreducens TaxID=1236968 RepID=A0A5A7N6P7_9PROT|nr:chloride channel protein [Iodidimonas nitroreducens]GAK33743.1 putative chloride channel protein ClcB-like [alpha proteobacterium Q-1]GER03992.1 chloride channel protein [Iodidimonas nitroreducens]